LEVSSGRLTAVDSSQVSDRSQWHTFDVPAGARIEVYLTATAAVSQRWGYLALAEPEALISRITCGRTTGMLPSPQFTVTLAADGTGKWDGEIAVHPLGVHTSQVGRAAFRRLARMVVAEGILDLGPERTHRLDVGTMSIGVERAGTAPVSPGADATPEPGRALRQITLTEDTIERPR
jgi:hypothetical protein